LAEPIPKIREKAFVAGATGYTGREAVRVLAEKGVPTVGHVRPDSPRIHDWRRRFAQMGASVDETAWELKAMTETFSRLRPAYIFSLLGTTRSRIQQVAAAGKDPKSQDYEAVDYGLAAMMIAAAQAAGIQPVFVYLSAAGVTPKAASPYYRARFKLEQELISSGLPYIIARPSFIIGPDRDEKRLGEIYGARLLDLLLSLAGLLGLKKLNARYRSTGNTVLAAALARLALDPDSAGKIFESENLRK
jgi:uncharacterized protein YbjT (DUF2867 family)